MPQSVFRKKNTNAFLTQSELSVDKNDAVIFIYKVLIWWKILYGKILQIDILPIDFLLAEIKSPTDSRLDFIIVFAQMVPNMASSQGNCMKQLSKHRATNIVSMELLVHVHNF